MSRASDARGRLPVEGFLDKSNWEENLWKTQNTLEGLHIPTGLGTPREEQRMWLRRRTSGLSCLACCHQVMENG